MVNISKILRFGIVGTSEKNRNYGNISIFKDSELWELILKIGIVGTYLRIGIVALIFRNYGTLPACFGYNSQVLAPLAAAMYNE
jgi:hypothetical protein